MNLHRLAPLTGRCVRLALLLVPLLFVAAMLCFPPGYRDSPGYSLSRHVISDLGRVRIEGVPNTCSCALFRAAMLLAATACGLFWLTRPEYLAHPTARRTARVCGLAMSLLLAATGLTPLDRVPRLHDPITAATAATAAAAMLALLADASDRLEHPRVKRGWLLSLFALAAVWSLLVLLHRHRLLAFRPWLPLGQKTLVAAFIAWMAYQSSLLRKAGDRLPAP